MSEAQENFRRWFVEPLQRLNCEPHGGFAVLMIAFPILERFLREKSGVGEGAISEVFYDEFHRIFGCPDRGLVPRLWHAYRNGLLHQATFSKQNRRGTVMPNSFITSSVALIDYDSTKDAFFVNPKGFSEKVIHAVENDFGVFGAASSASHPLSTVTSAASAGVPYSSPGPTGVM